jgi:DNA-binding CsgD family transcriptional regulator
MTDNGGQIGADLTPRERDVLAMVAAGMTNREIGEALFISESTAGVHVSNLMAKLGVSSRTEAASLAYRAGMVESAAGIPGADAALVPGAAAESVPPPGRGWGASPTPSRARWSTIHFESPCSGSSDLRSCPSSPSDWPWRSSANRP